MRMRARLRRGIAVLALVLPAGLPAADWPVRFSVPPVEPPVASVVAPGEVFTARVPAENVSGVPFAGTVEFVLLDYRERVRGRLSVPLSLAPKEKRTLEAPFAAPGTGPFKIGLRLAAGERSWERDIGAFAAWPAPSGPPRADSFFGYHVTSWHGDGRFLAQAARLGQGWQRAHNMIAATWWANVQPEPGPFRWEKMGYQIENNRRHGMRILGQLFSVPYWAAAGGLAEKQPGYPRPLKPDMKLFEAYVRETVARYRNDIRCWEIWNEPSVSLFWAHSPGEFAALCNAACRAAKEADPSCTVMAAGFSGAHPNWNEAAVRAGALKGIDAVSFHAYMPDGGPEAVHDALKLQAETFRRWSREYEPHRELPLWNSEGGWWTTTWLRGLYPDKPLDWMRPAILSVQFDAIQQRLGIVRFFYHLQNDGAGYGGVTPLEVNNAPRPLLMARVAMAAQVDGAVCVDDIRRPEGRFWAFLYETAGRPGTVIVCWAGRGGIVDAAVRWPGGVGVFDMMGNPVKTGRTLRVTEEPVYVRVAAPPSAVRKALVRARLAVETEPVPLSAPPEGVGPPDVPPLPPYAAPSENPAGVFFVDLRPWCTMGFADDVAGDGKGGWQDEGPFNDLRAMPVGRQVFHGVPFDVIDPATNNGLSIVRLRGMTLPTFPLKVSIPIPSRTCRALYFLHAGTTDRSYVVRYADGTTATIPVTIPFNDNNWWFGWRKGEDSRPVPVLAANTMDGKPAWRYVRVWEWQNPRPDAPIVGLDALTSEKITGYCGAALLAVTGVR